MKSVRFCFMTAAALLTAVFSGCSAPSDPQREALCGRWVQQNYIGGLPMLTMEITAKEITVYEGQIIFCRRQYQLSDDEITGIRPYTRIVITSSGDGTEVLNGMALDTESGEEWVRDSYVRE